jgi:hypothetical protein
MWDAPTAVDDRFSLCCDRRRVADSAIGLHSVPEIGVLIMFEGDDLSHYYNPRWARPAVHMDLREGGVEELSPEHLLEIMEAQEHRHLIWISRQICESESDVHFVWVLSHELAHLEENLIDPILSKAGYFLHATLGRVPIAEPQVTLTLPSEMYAELGALRIVRRVFSEQQVQDHLCCLPKNEAGRQCIDLLLKQEQRGQFDVVAQTAYFLETYLADLNEAKLEFDADRNIRQFDIDAAISELRGLSVG